MLSSRGSEKTPLGTRSKVSGPPRERKTCLPPRDPEDQARKLRTDSQDQQPQLPAGSRSRNRGTGPLKPLKKQKVSVGEAVERVEPSHTVGRNVKGCSHCGKGHGVPQEVKYYMIAIPLLSMKPKDLKAGSQRDV